MARTDGFKEFVLDQLADLRGLTCRAMFGGYGLRYRDTFFGIIHKGRLYFKVTQQATVESYRALGAKPFRVTSKMTLKTYYEVPTDVLEDAAQLAEWAETASTAQRPKPARRRAASKTRKSTPARMTRARSK